MSPIVCFGHRWSMYRACNVMRRGLCTGVPFKREESASDVYALEVSDRPRSQAILDAMALHASTHHPRVSNMVSGDLQGGFLTMLVRLTESKCALDVGTFTGFSALSIAEGMDPDGHVVTLERELVVANEAKKMLDRARETTPSLPKISMIEGDALQTMRNMSIVGNERFDFCFVDANKKAYWDYYEILVSTPLLVPGGVMVFDNTLFRNHVIHVDPLGRQGGIAASLDSFNRRLASDRRSHKLLVPLRDGLTIARKKRK